LHLKRVQVYAIDLLGFGESDKAVLDYSIELWRDQLVDFCQEFAGKPAILVGNSIGSLTSLAAAQVAGADTIKAVALLNCAGAHAPPTAAPRPHSLGVGDPKATHLSFDTWVAVCCALALIPNKKSWQTSDCWSEQSVAWVACRVSVIFLLRICDDLENTQ
jgi:pimeloyl-ACP methyl ester carboxylesterase